MEYEKIQSAYDELSNYILTNQNSKSKTSKLSEKIIKSMKIFQPYCIYIFQKVSDYDKFKFLNRDILVNHDQNIFNEISNMGFLSFNLVYTYENSKNDFGETRKLQPGGLIIFISDIDFDGSIVPRIYYIY